MSRDITSAFETAMAADTVRPVFFVKAEFVSDTLYLWTGRGTISWDGQTWTGSGNLLTVAEIKETADLKVNEVNINFSGLPDELKSIALSEVQGKNKLTVWLGLLDSSLNVIADPEIQFIGYMDEVQLNTDTKIAQFSLNVLNRLVKMQSPSNARYTNRDQLERFATDTACRHCVNATKEIKWGSA